MSVCVCVCVCARVCMCVCVAARLIAMCLGVARSPHRGPLALRERGCVCV